MAIRKFESHITFSADMADFVKLLVIDWPAWQFSQIDGDPVMGQKVYCYLTAYNNDAERLLVEAKRLSASCLAKGVPALRVKVEEIIYDTKTNLDNISN